MIRVTRLSRGKLVKGDLEKLSKKGEVWIDCVHPTKKELADLSRATGIALVDLNRALDEDERPAISDFEEYSVITFHAPSMEKSRLTVPLTLIIKDNILVIVRTTHIESIESLKTLDADKKVDIFQKDMTHTIYMILSEVINHFFRITDDIESEIDKIEQNIYKTQNERTVKEIFSLKKTLIYYHKSLTGNREVITGIEKHLLKQVKGKNVKEFRYLYNDVIQLIDMVATYREILTSSMDIYLTSVSNNVNEVMKKLTIIASFVLVPTLISGIYGMNFQYMPEIHTLKQWGYPFSLALMALSVGAVYMYFNKKNWM